MTKKTSTFAIMLCLASSLAFAGDQAKSASSDKATATTASTSDNGKSASSDEATTTAATSDNATQKDKCPCDPAKETSKGKVKAKPAHSNQEEEFDRVLRGIYG